jgi:SulP family sulfate permease
MLLDSTAANVLAGTARKAANAGIRFIITGTSTKDRKILSAAGVKPPDTEFADSIDKALETLRKTANRA